MNEPSLPEESIFAQALEAKSAAKRAAYLDRACGANPRLRADVEALLRANEKSGDLLDLPEKPAATVEEPPSTEAPGTRIGPYKLVEQIGEGGMGTVWMAEQQEPVRRLVALKVIKAGMDSTQVIARFEAERQALALMDHPNIAKVLDAGTIGSEPQTTEPRPTGSGEANPLPIGRGSGIGSPGSGRPYFVMELVKGTPITKYCDEHRLTPRQRLELFVPVCQAIQHAHQKGIIHRDVKPSNVLVAPYDGKPVVKVIDFGVAKATGQRLTERTLFTGFGAVVGTLEYMSPEQAELNNQDIDTRSDIYSLGVLLYELLTGTTPLTRERLKQAAFTEMLRIIREEEPPKPSTRLSSSDTLPAVAEARQTEPMKLMKLVRGELDWIVMKALEKERTRRYESVNGLARDIERYLADEPVDACPPSAGYRLKKFARKYKKSLTMSAAFVLLLVAGVVASTWQAVRATRAEEKTGRALDQVTQEQRKTREALEQVKMALAAERTAKTQAREALDALMNDVVETMFAQQPELAETEKAFLRKVLASYEAITQELGETAEARFLRARGYFKVARLRHLLGEPDEAGWRQAVALLEQLAADFPDVPQYREKLARSQDYLGNELTELGKRAEAETALRRALDLLGRLAGDFPKVAAYRRELAVSNNNLGNLLRLQRKYADAEEAFRQAVSLDEQLAKESATYHSALARSRSNLASLLRERRKYAAAEALYRQALSVQEKRVAEFPVVPKGRLELADSYHGLGIVLAEQRKPEEAETAIRQALDLRKKLADDFPKVVIYRRGLAADHNDLGTLLRRQNKYVDAEGAFRQAINLREKMVAEIGDVPRYHQELARSYDNLGVVLAELRKPEEAETAFREAQSRQAKLADDSPKVAEYRLELATTRFHLGNLFRLQRRHDQALPWYDQALVLLQPLHRQQPDDAATREALFRTHWGRAQVLDALKGPAAALADWDRAVELAPPADRLGVQLLRARAWARAGKVAEAVADAEALTKDAATPSARCCDAACVFSLASAAAQDAGQREAYAGQALALFRRAQAAGFFKDRAKIERLKRDSDLKPLRQREDFRKFIAELEAAAKP
jgi:serine/threonine protein kinase/tetratricopeptide (TPR) repeat protein